jgi:hypothetical protein
MQFSKVEPDVFATSTFMVVGNGQSTLFWEDRWLDGMSIRRAHPEAAQIESHGAAGAGGA